MYGSSRTSPAEPKDVAVENKQFAGLLDKIQVFNEARSAGTVKILSGGHYKAAVPAPPAMLDVALALRLKAAIDGKTLQRLGPTGSTTRDTSKGKR